MKHLSAKGFNNINELEPSPEWFDLTAQQIRDALVEDSSKAKVTQLVDEIRVLRQSTEDLLVHAWTRGKNVARDYRGDVLEVCPYGDGTAPILYTFEQLRASNEASWFAGRDQGTKYGMTFDNFGSPPHTEGQRDNAYGVNPHSKPSGHAAADAFVNALSAYDDDWCGPNTFAPTPKVMSRLTAVLNAVALLPSGLSVGADLYGGVILEWHALGLQYTVGLHADDGTIDLTCSNLETDALSSIAVPDDAALAKILESSEQ